MHQETSYLINSIKTYTCGQWNLCSKKWTENLQITSTEINLQYPKTVQSPPTRNSSPDPFVTSAQKYIQTVRFINPSASDANLIFCRSDAKFSQNIPVDTRNKTPWLTKVSAPPSKNVVIIADQKAGARDVFGKVIFGSCKLFLGSCKLFWAVVSYFEQL